MPLVAVLHLLDLLHDVHSLDHLAEDRVADACPAPFSLFRKSLFLTLMKNCDVALSGADVRAMASVPASFFSPFDDSFLIGGLLALALVLHVGGQAAALDHEAGDHAVEDRAVVVAGVHVGEEVLDRLRGLVGDRARP